MGQLFISGGSLYDVCSTYITSAKAEREIAIHVEDDGNTTKNTYMHLLTSRGFKNLKLLFASHHTVYNVL